MSDRRTVQANEASIRRRRRVLEDIEAERTEQTLMALENAVGAESPVNPSLADRVEEPPFGQPAGSALPSLLLFILRHSKIPPSRFLLTLLDLFQDFCFLRRLVLLVDKDD